MTPGDQKYRADQRAQLLRFGAGSRHDLGFGYLDRRGVLDPSRPVELYITCRMTHVFSLGLLADEPPISGGPDSDALRSLAEHGIRSLGRELHDDRYGGWYPTAGRATPESLTKQAYGHAFVLLCASSAHAAGIDGADDVLSEALWAQNQHFLDHESGLVVDEWDRTWTSSDPYRGLNSNMHTVEAYLAAGDVTSDDIWHHRAGRIAARVIEWARVNDWRIPEHYSPSWTPILDYHKEKPADPFQPYGATIGHGLEWARLLVTVASTLGADAPKELLEAAIALADRAVSDGWARDGSDGFVYTTDWHGKPVVRSRMHWVVAEAISTATVLQRLTGEQRYAEDAARWWTYADRYLVDRELGSWHHELDASNTPASQVWPGKPDIYHAYQAALMPDAAITPSFAASLAGATPKS